MKGSLSSLLYRTDLCKAFVDNSTRRFYTDHEILKATTLTNLTLWPTAKDNQNVAGDLLLCVEFYTVEQLRFVCFFSFWFQNFFVCFLPNAFLLQIVLLIWILKLNGNFEFITKFSLFKYAFIFNVFYWSIWWSKCWDFGETFREEIYCRRIWDNWSISSFEIGFVYQVI